MMKKLLLAVAVSTSGCTQAFVEIRHDRPSLERRPPDTVFSIGARWYFWDAYGDWLAGKVGAAAQEAR